MNVLSPYQTLLTQGLDEINKAKITPRQWQVLHHLRDCRTERMGTYDWRCEKCGHDVTWYCSCRDRHCPKCQEQMRRQWLVKRSQDILPVVYHHLVFTLPHEFNALIKAYPREVYQSLFHSVWATLRAFANPRHHLEGQLGALMVLHTWGRNLSQHTHVHCLIPGGVLTEDNAWLPTRREGYLFPVKALSVRFKKEMMRHVQQVIDTHENLLIEANSKAWVVYSKPVLHNPRAVVGYLSRYCNRIGLNPNQLTYGNNGSIEMTYKDHQTQTLKRMSCSPGEMLRRLLLHVLPKGVMRIRYYGFLANAVRARAISEIKKSITVPPHEVKEVTKEKPSCPNCKSRSMVLIRIAIRPRVVAEKERLS
ncbi:IS91 family transposase [Vibrio ouci]|uniref:IS91 family transposase n=1 Tax=Vibrio ouci TaxID=2499078 RepID=A0A4Y8WBN3_9VIBR|nr:IS91 family transposase [Vibrio ouci]TFH89691.1 IS91 family transposase [Vibrio ouci]